MESVEGMMAAPPSPMMARMTTRVPVLAENAAHREKIPNTTNPAWSTRFLPRRSPIVPMVSSVPAKTSV